MELKLHFNTHLLQKYYQYMVERVKKKYILTCSVSANIQL